jgi:hypothetical protein
MNTKNVENKKIVTENIPEKEKKVKKESKDDSSVSGKS